MKKKVIIFTSAGGGGHITTQKALSHYLGDSYEIKPIYIFDTVLKSLDLIKKITFGKLNGETSYNYFLTRGWLNSVNVLYKLGVWYYGKRNKKATQLIKKFVDKEKPDLVISIAPIINGNILEATQQSDIPFLLIPTDLDATSFLSNMVMPRHKNFYITLAFDEPSMKKIVHQAGIPAKHISVTGFPIRPDFLEHKDAGRIKKQFNIPPNKPIALVLLGACGSMSMNTVAQELAKVSFPAHVVLCLGRNTAIKKKVEAVDFPAHITRTILGFTPHISDLMFVADVFLTKSGSVSVFEALYMNVPMLLDATKTILIWEQFNHPFIKNHQFGESIASYKDIPALVEQRLRNKTLNASIKGNLQRFEKKNGGEEIKKLIDSILNKSV